MVAADRSHAGGFDLPGCVLVSVTSCYLGVATVAVAAVHKGRHSTLLSGAHPSSVRHCLREGLHHEHSVVAGLAHSFVVPLHAKLS